MERGAKERKVQESNSFNSSKNSSNLNMTVARSKSKGTSNSVSEKQIISDSTERQLESTSKDFDENSKAQNSSPEMKEFWDFLTEINEIKSKYNDSEMHASEFLDFLKPDCSDAVDSHSKERSTVKSQFEFFSTADSGLGESLQKGLSQASTQFNQGGKSSKGDVVSSQSGEDPFWDFLKKPNNPEPSKSDDDEFWDFMYSKANQQKAADSEDEFWDFLKHDSPDELHEVVKSITDSIQPTPRSDATDTPMSLPPFSDFTRLQTGINTSTPVGSIGVGSNLQPLERSLNSRLGGSKGETSMGNSKFKTIASLPQGCTSGSGVVSNQREKVASNQSRLGNFASVDKSKALTTENSIRQGGNLPCCSISSVYSMQPYSSTGKVVTEVFPSSVGYTVSNSIVQSVRTSRNPSVFIQDRNKTLPLTKVCSGKKITNVFPIRKHVVNKNLKVDKVNKRSLPNNSQPNIETSNVSTSKSSINEAQKNLPRKIQEIKVTQISQASSEQTTPDLICTSQTNPVTSSEMKNNPNPLYFLVPGNSESFKNPNYSHYFVVVNNNQTNKPPEVNTTQNQNLIVRTSAPSSTVSTTNQSVSISQLANVPVVRHMMLPKPLYVQSSNSDAQGVGNSTSIKVLDQNQVKNVSLPNSSVVNLTNVVNCSTSSLNQQYSQNMLQSFGKNAMTNVNYIPVSSIMLKEPLFKLKNTATANLLLPLTNSDSNTPNVPVSKPIKNIPLGENKNAILQLRIPEIMENVPDEDLATISNNEEIIPPLNVPLRPEPHSFSQGSTERPLPKQDAVLKPVVKYAVLTGQQILSNYQQNKQTVSNDVNALSNPSILSQPSQTYTLSLNINNPIMKQTNTTLPNNLNTVNNLNLVQNSKPNQYVQVKLAPPPNTIQSILPTPVSMVPISIVQPTLTSCQPRVSKVLVLKGQPQTVQCNPVVTTRRPYATRLGKSKKNGPKTVRQLLEEFRKKQLSQGQRQQKPILRRILKMPVNTAYGGGTLPGTLRAGPATGNYVFNDSNVISKKRPNILVLPSASKHIKKNVIREISAKSLVTRRELDFSGSPTNCDTECDSYLNGSDYPFSCDKRDFRPRHYDLSELQIGFFKVEDDIEYSCGRFRSKFKVLFSKCQFLYDFPVSRCNRMDLKSSHIWEKRVRVVVPFKSITSMEMRDRIIIINLSSSPSIYLGRVQAKAGIISNTIVYDTLIEDGSQWGDDIKNTLTHKVVLRKRQANKLKSSLCEFDDNFVLLTNVQELGTPATVGSSMMEKDTPDSNKKDGLKNKKLRIRRLSRWDSPDDGEESNSDDSTLLENQMCSCRISCRSIRCSCVKAARSCKSSKLCLCVSCDNPLNLLEALGMDIEFSLSDSCLFQNIYPIPKLADFLKREMKLACCNTFARVQDCIPGTVLCPNVNCNVHLEFSWCRGIVCYPERNPRNHCSFCGQCCFSNKRHCFTCRRCYIISPKIPFCPTCKEIPPQSTDMLSSPETSLLPVPIANNQKTSNPPPKPEIILLDYRTVPKPIEDEQKTISQSDTKDENPQVSQFQDMITIESPKEDDQALLEYAATL